MYFIRMGKFAIVGSSPEMLVRVEGQRAEMHPIAGTRPRGRTEDEDLLSAGLMRARGLVAATDDDASSPSGPGRRRRTSVVGWRPP